MKQQHLPFTTPPQCVSNNTKYSRSTYYIPGTLKLQSPKNFSIVPVSQIWKLRIRVSLTWWRWYRLILGKARVWCWLGSLPFKTVLYNNPQPVLVFKYFFLYTIYRLISLTKWNHTILLSITIFSSSPIDGYLHLLHFK